MYQKERIINKIPPSPNKQSPQEETNEFDHDVKDYCKNLRLNTSRIE